MTEDKKKAEAVRQLTFQQCVSAVQLTSLISDGSFLGAQLAAIETLASILRRQSRDFGVSKEDVDSLRAIASRDAERIYEESGMGAAVRAIKRAHDEEIAAAAASAAPPSDSAFSAEARAEAARLAAEAFQRITLKKDT